ncbi:unnamed protein product [Diamesa serratosioi]
MDTKALKSVGIEKLKCENRQEKFKLPALFALNSPTADLNINEIDKRNCKYTSVIDKPTNREIYDKHLKRKETKLKSILKKKTEDEMRLDKEKSQLEIEDNLAFQIAEQSFETFFAVPDVIPISERDNFKMPRKKVNYPVNETELQQLYPDKFINQLTRKKGQMNILQSIDGMEYGIDCGQKVGDKIMLRSFKDRLCNEPRGKFSYFHLKENHPSTCDTYDEWLNKLTNDPDILRRPPKERILSTVNVPRDANDDKKFIFEDNKKPTKVNSLITSPIKEYIQQLNTKLEARKSKLTRYQTKSQQDNFTNLNDNRRRTQSKNFMSIPMPSISETCASTKKCTKNEIHSIVAKVSKASLLKPLQRKSEKVDKSFCKYTINSSLTNKRSPQAVECLPQNRSSVNELANEAKESWKIDPIPSYKNVKPHRKDVKKLHHDKSLPWIQDDLDATKIRIQMENEEQKKSFDIDFIELEHSSTNITVKRDYGHESSIKKLYLNCIANKLNELKSTPLDTVATEEQTFDFETIESVSMDSVSFVSSDCTNFTNDSGSYVVMLDDKVPMENFRNAGGFQNHSMVTVEEKQVLSDSPHIEMPYCGQFIMMKDLFKPPDRFHTHKTRSCAGIRERNHIEFHDDELIGTDDFQMAPKMATDFDEYYQSVIHHQSSIIEYRYKPITEMIKLRKAFRNKLSSFFIREDMIESQIHALEEDRNFNKINETISIYESFLKNYKEVNYRHSMKKMQEVKNYYRITDELRIKHKLMQAKVEPLKMKIFYLGTDFIRRSIMQNFQYLMMPNEWRLKHDFLHRNANGDLESFKDSIANRENANLWDRNNVSVLTIRNFFYNDYLKRKDKLMIIFPDAKSFLSSFKELQSKSYRSLLQFHLAAHSLADVDLQFVTIQQTTLSFLENKERFVKNLSKKKVYMQKRAKEIGILVENMTKEPLENSFSKSILVQLQGLCELLFRDKMMGGNSTSESKYLSIIEKFSEIEKRIFQDFELLDQLPSSVFTETQYEVRNERIIKLRQAHRAYRIENNLKTGIDQMRRCLAKPTKKEKRIGKLPISVIPQKHIKPKKQQPIMTTLEEEYVRAFTELGSGVALELDDNARSVLTRIKNESIPFYVDHLLDKLGLKMQTDIVTDIERRFGDEVKYLKYKGVIPKVLDNFERWKKAQEIEKKKNILKTLYLYE